MIRLTVGLHGFEFFIGSLFDSFYRNVLVRCELSENQFRRIIGLLDPTLFVIFHPSSGSIAKQLTAYESMGYFMQFRLAIIDFLDKNALLLPIHYVLQLVVVFFILVAFLALFASFFSNNKEELQADVDYSVSTISAEAEKELFAVDDVTGLFVLMFFIFAVYFGILSLAVELTYAEFLVLLAALPVTMFFMLLMPFNLIYDFGLLFVAYLRGVANTSSFFFELVYDYIGVAAFITRLAVQFVRLGLMFIVYCMMHDAVMLQAVSMRAQVYGDSF